MRLYTRLAVVQWFSCTDSNGELLDRGNAAFADVKNSRLIMFDCNSISKQGYLSCVVFHGMVRVMFQLDQVVEAEKHQAYRACYFINTSVNSFKDSAHAEEGERPAVFGNI